MRRQRARLQVSLFPFLAVLLCTLGALILLLLIIDQRARSQTAEAAQAAAEAHEREAQAQREASEREARARAEANARDADAVRARLEAATAARDQARRAAEKLDAERAAAAKALAQKDADLAALRASVEAERAVLARRSSQLPTTQAQVAEAQRQKQSADARLAALLEQVRQMERAVEEMKAAAARTSQKPLYSLIPYKGRLGTEHRPIYLECVNGRVVFRPDGESVPLGLADDAARLRRAIEARQPQAGGSTRPYALLLVRPSGISLYYQIMHALQGTAIDIGYEFIDEDWTLDFTPAEGADDSVAVNARPPVARLNSGVLPGSGGVQGADLQPPNPPTRVPGNGGQGDSLRPGKTPGGTPGSPGSAPAWIGAKPGAAAAEGGTTPPAAAAARHKPGNTTEQDMPDDNNGPGAKPGSPAGKAASGDKRGGDGADGEGQGKTGAPGGKREGTPREWTILIECTSDAIIVHPQKVHVDPARLPARRLDNALSTLVRALIEEKRAKNPAVQPHLRFAIRPDGLRTYYSAAAALDSLNLPFTCDVVAAEQAVERD